MWQRATLSSDLHSGPNETELDEEVKYKEAM